MSKVKDSELTNIARIYNDEGRQAAYKLIESLGVKQPYAVLKRMKNNPKFIYDKDKNMFINQESFRVDDVFMSMEELCSPVTIEPNLKVDNRSIAMEKLIQDLLGDRLLELSKFITLEASSRIMMIDQTSLRNEGYKIISY